MLVGAIKARDSPLGPKSEATPLGRSIWGKTSVELSSVAISGYTWILIRRPWGREAGEKPDEAPHPSQLDTLKVNIFCKDLKSRMKKHLLHSNFEKVSWYRIQDIWKTRSLGGKAWVADKG